MDIRQLEHLVALVELGTVTETPQFLEKEGYTKGLSQEVIATISTRSLENLE